MTKESHLDVSHLEELLDWSTKSYTPVELSQLSIQWPVVAKIDQGFYDEEEESELSGDQVVVLRRWHKQKRVLARSSKLNGITLSFPIENCPLKFEIIYDKKGFVTVSSIMTLQGVLESQPTFPIKVQIFHPQHIGVRHGNQLFYAKDFFGELMFAGVYEEVFLSGCTVNDGNLNGNPLLLHQASKVQMKVASGIKNQPLSMWQKLWEVYGSTAIDCLEQNFIEPVEIKGYRKEQTEVVTLTKTNKKLKAPLKKKVIKIIEPALWALMLPDWHLRLYDTNTEQPLGQLSFVDFDQIEVINHQKISAQLKEYGMSIKPMTYMSHRMNGHETMRPPVRMVAPPKARGMKSSRSTRSSRSSPSSSQGSTGTLKTRTSTRTKSLGAISHKQSMSIDNAIYYDDVFVTSPTSSSTLPPSPSSSSSSTLPPSSSSTLPPSLDAPPVPPRPRPNLYTKGKSHDKSESTSSHGYSTAHRRQGKHKQHTLNKSQSVPELALQNKKNHHHHLGDEEQELVSTLNQMMTSPATVLSVGDSDDDGRLGSGSTHSDDVDSKPGFTIGAVSPNGSSSGSKDTESVKSNNSNSSGYSSSSNNEIVPLSTLRKHHHLYASTLSVSSDVSSLGDMPRDIESFDMKELSECLKLLKLERHVEKFEENQIDGALLKTLDESILTADLGLNTFEARKLTKFANGWRPMCM